MTWKESCVLLQRVCSYFLIKEQENEGNGRPGTVGIMIYSLNSEFPACGSLKGLSLRFGCLFLCFRH